MRVVKFAKDSQALDARIKTSVFVLITVRGNGKDWNQLVWGSGRETWGCLT